MNDDEIPSAPDSALDDEPQALPDLATTPPPLPAPRPGRRLRVPDEAVPPLGSLEARVYVVEASQQTMFQRVDQLAKLLEQDHMRFQSLTQEMADTLKLLQESFQALDALADKIAILGAANVKMFQAQMQDQDQGIF